MRHFSLCFILIHLLFGLSGCASDCKGLRSFFKSALGGECTLSDVASITVTAATPFVSIGSNVVQMTAIATYDDGTSLDVSNEVNWTISNSSTGAVDNAGLFTSSATDGGLTQVSAQLSGVIGSTQLKVIGPVTDIAIGTNPFYALKRPNSNEVWVLNNDLSNQISVIDISNNTLSATINLGAGYNPNHIVFLQDGSKAYLSSSGAGPPSHTIFAIDSATKIPTVVTTTSVYGVQLAVTPDSASVYFAQNMGVSDVFKIDTVTDVVTTFDNVPAMPTGVAISSSGKLYVSDQGHGGNDWIYSYADYTNTSSTNFPIAGWVATHLKISPNSSRLFAISGAPANTAIIDVATDTILENLGNFGGWSFFDDNARAVYGVHGSNYRIYNYSGVTLNLEDTITINSPNGGGTAAITADETLYIPVGATNTVRVYQYR